MGIYVCSDVHGNYRELKRILQDIKFEKEDRLIINGDLIDRGSESAQLMEFVLDNENIEFLLGNHEYMFMKGFEIFPEIYKGKVYSSNARRFEETYLHYINGGKSAMDSLRRYYKCNERDLAQEFYEYLKTAKVFKDINGIQISHTGRYELNNLEESIWDRSPWVFAFTGAREVVGKSVIGHSSIGLRYLTVDEESVTYSFMIENYKGEFLINLDGSDRGVIPVYDLEDHIVYFRKTIYSEECFKIDLKSKFMTRINKVN